MIDASNSNFCPAPWISVYVDPDGAVDNCCVGKNNIGNVNESSLPLIVRGERNRDIQIKMLNDQPVSGCNWCHDSSHNLQRTFFQYFPDVRSDPLVQTPGEFELRYADLRWSNTCNFACVYCGPVYSSTWATELQQVHRVERESKNSMVDFVMSNVGTIKRLYLAGGEPLMMKENEMVLQHFLEHNPEVQIVTNTNLSEVKGNRIFDLLRQFPNSHFLVSVDDQEDRYEYIRYPGQWSTFSDNLEILRNSVDIQRVAFNIVIGSFNAVTVWDLVDQLQDAGYLAQNMTLQLYNNGVMSGPWAVRHMPESYQRLAMERMNQDRYRTSPGWQNLWDHVKSLTYETHQDPWAELSKLDQRRGLRSQEIFPLLYQHKP
jgi:sulfatase maturation enzyme AslB (radical SAM superfamily)